MNIMNSKYDLKKVSYYGTSERPEYTGWHIVANPGLDDGYWLIKKYIEDGSNRVITIESASGESVTWNNKGGL